MTDWYSTLADAKEKWGNTIGFNNNGDHRGFYGDDNDDECLECDLGFYDYC